MYVNVIKLVQYLNNWLLTLIISNKKSMLTSVFICCVLGVENCHTVFLV
jgi:hypothetical protein